MDKNISRLRRAKKTRARIAGQGKLRLAVYRSGKHIYAQIIDDAQGRVLTQASSLEKDVRGTIKNGGSTDSAALIGKRVAEKAKGLGITEVAFDRSGYRYHGRVKALAEAARESGLSF
ncbi:50S ribosomal protein L18 [Acidithiobacillus sp. CV18-2]|uniref:Large ribosomal subunit protein uL18 n=1 Tax=Igneacidithiobacillus copahuensis TaxID=2724909 RepID=A0AAE2YN11_9PROT|nr:50S ribosomal protein L18 [Igneacidithiobacillus copahuensis]MBU2754004.1 50S ribosomal protein L18 [Acidithiobacillus sp. CV18-3]MBU2756232.1 50S ribosomal protein L18 [Acidithiobacillus sp. BN09-2]MBU2778677.1 50S ribosomal protein L18 [Acidithiobacillus sp. CV18-2]MBU2797244.1 50S ribosomal protein L18 [Acidithiobacillus sp. VAN18-2]MBU2798867.1 50S ribosomal protein L18 [Acidithiobacillus sp. VAN18-4]UTV81408.1 50S ribosomal protein L18 [Acidithiobacillus sp. YTS05]